MDHQYFNEYTQKKRKKRMRIEIKRERERREHALTKRLNSFGCVADDKARHRPTTIDNHLLVIVVFVVIIIIYVLDEYVCVTINCDVSDLFPGPGNIWPRSVAFKCGGRIRVDINMLCAEQDIDVRYGTYSTDGRLLLH